MKKQTIDDNFFNTLTLISENDTSKVYKTNDGEIVKLFMPLTLQVYYNVAHINLEAKLLNKEKCYISEEIIKPNTVYYARNGMAVGYKMKPAQGIDYNHFDKTLSKDENSNLIRFNTIQKKLEKIIKKNNDIIFPDLCTCDNIYIDGNDNIELIDYDGMQIGKHQAIQMSTTLNEIKNNYYIPKYWQHNLFTKNLDKKSLIMLYFLTAFHVNLDRVGVLSPFTRKPVTLDETFWLMGLQDNEIFDKVVKIFQNNEDNVYLEDSIDKIAKDYNVKREQVGPNAYIKKLYKK